MTRLIILILLITLISCKSQSGTIWLTEEEVNMPQYDTIVMPYLNARCIYNDSTSEKPVRVQGYFKKDSTYVKPHKRSVPKY
jgi:hypothetical protein